MLIFIPFLLPLLSSASVSSQINSLRSRMLSAAGSRDNFGEKSPLDSIILNGRFQAWLDSKCSDKQTEECMEYFASLRSRSRVTELMDEIFTPVEVEKSREELQQAIEELSAEIDQVESELVAARSQLDDFKLKKYIHKYMSKMLKTMGSCRSPPGSPNIQFVSTREFQEIRTHFDKYTSDLLNAKSIREVDLSYIGFIQYLKQITSSGLHPQIAWNACKAFYLQHAYADANDVNETEVSAIEIRIRTLQRKRGDLVLQKSIKNRSLAGI